MTLPLVPAKTQFDGSDHAAENCSCASGARLMRYATGTNVSGGAVRSHQSDQSGGTSIPDVMRALHNGWSFEPVWASSNDSNGGGSPQPANKVSGWIDADRLQALLGKGYMVMLQGDYGDLPVKYREQTTFRDDHCFTLDSFDKTAPGLTGAGYYAVDTIPRAASGYDGRWIPLVAIHSYAYGLAGTGRFYAAWARPASLPDTGTEGDVFDKPFSIPQQPSMAESKGAKLYTNASFTGTSYAIPAGDTKRFIGYVGDVDDPTALIIGHDRDASVPGKSALYGRPREWARMVIP